MEKEIALIKCLDEMWDAFIKSVSVDQEELIQKFLLAKDKAHQILAYGLWHEEGKA